MMLGHSVPYPCPTPEELPPSGDPQRASATLRFGLFLGPHEELQPFFFAPSCGAVVDTKKDLLGAFFAPSYGAVVDTMGDISD